MTQPIEADCAPDSTVQLTRNTAGLITSVNDAIVGMLGWQPAEWVGSPSTKFLHPEDQASGIAMWMEMITVPGSTHVWRGRYQTADGSWAWVETVNRLEETDDPIVVSSMTRVTVDEVNVEEEGRAREQLLSRLSDALPVGVFQVDLNGRVTFANDRLYTILGVRPAATVDAHMTTVVPEDRPLVAAALASVFADEPVDDIEIRLCPGGEADVERVCTVSLRALTDGRGVVNGVVGCLSDDTDRVQLRRQLELKAAVDELTGCLNRAATIELLGQTIARSTAAGVGSAVVYIDLDRFKRVNDRFGHAAGDRLLVLVADRLRAAVRGCDDIGRLGGDEFLVICPNVPHAVEALAVADRIALAITTLAEVGPGTVELRASVGVAFSSGGLDADALIAHADTAMYEAKRAGAERATLFTGAAALC